LRMLLGILGVDVPGIKQVFFGIVLLLVVIAVPEGVWPWVARKFGLMERRH
jgi:branched-chain amino acid transport system permease protein